MKLQRVAVCLSLLLCMPAPVHAQKSERDSAFALVDQGRTTEALPLLEKLVAQNPDDIEAHQRLGLSLLKVSGLLTDAAARKQQRVRARGEFEKAAQLGTTSTQILGLLRTIPADGGADPTYSSNAAADEVMQKAEAAFSAGDNRLAFTLYQQALALDPNSYSAALFSGDTYVHSPNFDSAYVWYARATQIDADRETAWRYWSDVLLKHDKLDEARDKAVEAMIAEPYKRLSMAALNEWASKTKTAVNFPRIDLAPGTAAVPSTPARAAYDSVRRTWKGDDAKGGAAFRAAYPTEGVYRHSVGEERAALQAAYRVDPANVATVNLKKMDDAGMLESFVLIAGADQGIASEYERYRSEHRDALRNFWKSFVIGAPYK